MTSPQAGSYRLGSRVAAYVTACGVLRAGERALLLLSGGADSMALLDLLPEVGRRLDLGLSFAALHVDYATRGVDSDRDRHIVEEACESTGVPLHVLRLRRGLEGGGGFQARAREVRYRRARELSREHAYDVIVTGHNRDDQAETVLYRLTKYATPRGLVGMRPREDQLARPLLCLGAEEIRDHCCAQGIRYGEDVTNAQPRYARNIIRLEVMPHLRHLNPRVAETLAASAGMAAAEADVLHAATTAAVERVAVQRAPGDLAAFDVAALAAESAALRTLVLHHSAREAMGGGALVERRVVDGLVALAARRDDAGRVSLGRGLEAIRADGCIRLRRRRPAHACVSLMIDDAALAAAGEEGVSCRFCGRRFRVRLVPGPALVRDARQACVGFAGTPRGVMLRHPRRGDRFAPLGLGSETTVARYLGAARVPSDGRVRALVLDVDGAVAWVGYSDRTGETVGRVAHSFRVDESSRCTVRLLEEDQ